jgi:hypothetical protein
MKLHFSILCYGVHAILSEGFEVFEGGPGGRVRRRSIGKYSLHFIN